MTEGYWKDWLPQMIRSWARDFARASNAGRMVKNARGEEEWHFDGWPQSSLMGRVQTEGHGAGQGAAQGTEGQHFAEVYSPEGLKVRRAMEGLRIEARGVLYAAYLTHDIPHRERMEKLGLAKTQYWDLYEEAHIWIASGISQIEAAEAAKQPQKCPDSPGAMIAA